jgi:hypothetical protein
MNKFDAEYYRYYFSFLNEIADLYGMTYDDVARLVYSAGLSTDKRFAFRGNKRLSEETDNVLKQLAEATTATIVAGTAHTWGLSNTKNDEITRAFLHDRAIPERFMRHNTDKLAALQKRKIDGLTVSSRVWKYTESLKTDLEMAIDVALKEGTSAAELSRSIRRNLNNPDALFRRVRNQYGQLVPSKAMLAYHPGAGVCRSAAQNAIRLAGTEINMAYREADLLRWQQQDFVVGYEVKTSLRKLTVCPLCGELQGVYPKNFVWVGWHPRCRCYATPVLAKEGEFIDWLNNGSSANFSGQMTDTPTQFKKYLTDHSDQVGRAMERGKLPYWVRDNDGGYIDLSKFTAPKS